MLAAALLTVASTASAAPSSDRSRHSHDRAQELLAGANLSKPVRAYADVAWNQTPAPRRAAWQRLQAAMPGMASASWDRATGVPSRIWGRGLDVPGSVADAAIAEAAAWRVLAQHLDLLAPGAVAGDFVVVANVGDGAMRTVGLRQRHAGLDVVGGQVSFRFKRDRLFVIGSEALPDVAVAWPQQLARTADLGRTVAAATVAELDLNAASVSARADATPVILPLVGERGVLGYRVAIAVDVDAGAAGGWRVWADASTGAPILRHSITPSASGAVAFDAVERWTGRGRRSYPVKGLAVTVNGVAGMTDALGRVSWTGTAPAAITLQRQGDAQQLSPVGPMVAVESLGGDAVPLQPSGLQVSADGTVVVRPGPSADVVDDEIDAQISAFIHATIVKDYVRGFAPNLAYLDVQQQVKVNISDACNAFSNLTTIHFFRASDRCANTATIADVVYHEFGHSMHKQSMIDGVGFFDGAFSEGLSDYLAATITNDSGMGRGFFKTDAPLRQLDPIGSEAMWPRDIGEIHTTGLIFGGAMWDLRKALVAELGYAPGVALADRLFYGAVQRATSIPATLVEILAEDDDDGDLANGTPHECTIRAAFGRHGLRTIASVLDAPGSVASAHAEPQPVTLRLEGLDVRCGDLVAGVKLEWHPRGGGPTAGSVAATAEGDAWTAALPMPDDGSPLFYRFRVQFADASEIVYPDNRAEPWYMFYRGDVVPLYCTDFETNPFVAGWRAGGEAAADWQWGTPASSRGVGDPTVAFSGQRILGTGLSFTDGTYRGDARSWVETPTVDVGRYSDVRLQYRRWLTVEDGFYDQASIEVNGQRVYTNLASQGQNSHSTHHEDKTWMFQDVSLSTRIDDGKVVVRWLLAADQAFALGGWNLDDVCIVANPRDVCGDGVKAALEQCDDGDANADAADRCRTNCRFATCGDGVVDTVEACDDGNQDDRDDCNGLCEVVVAPATELAGGCSTGGGGGLAGVASGLALALLVTRRRQRR